MTPPPQISPVLVETQGPLGHIRLNRPQAINSLTLTMVRHIAAALDRFERDPAVAAVVLSGAGPRGLCAGGDIRAIYATGRNDPDQAMNFFREEYRLNARIAKFPKPYIAIMDGITMGGGVGLSAHGALRIVTETTRMAMPETGIGFFPDVGGTWLLAHAPGETGTYLGLTATQIGAADAIQAGLADFLIHTARLAAFTAALGGLPAAAGLAEVRAVAARYAARPAAAVLPVVRAEIDAAFAFARVEDIVAALERSGTEFAQTTRAALATRSPVSLKLTLRLLRLGRSSPGLEACLQREYNACIKILAGTEFYEGVRAAVIDKDRRPRWSPAALGDVSEQEIASYLAPASVALFPDV